jgi:hypothetical protein
VDSFAVFNLKDNGSWYCWGIDEPLWIDSDDYKPYAKEQKATFRNLITWFKNPSGLGDGQNPSARSYGIITEKLFVMLGVQGFANDLSNCLKVLRNLENIMKLKQKMG